MNLTGLRTQLARLAAAVPRNLPDVSMSVDAVDLVFAAGAVLARLEEWAAQRPGFEPMPEPTVLHQPDEGDRALARNCPRLAAALAEPCLVHAAGVLETRLGVLFTQYAASGEHDTEIDAALADVDSRLAEIMAAGVPITDWCAAWLIPLQRIS